MKSKQISLLLACSLVAIGIIAILYFLSPLSRAIYRAEFQRKFLHEPYSRPNYMLNVGVNSFYIAGYSKDELYLGNTTAPLNVLKTSFRLCDSAHITLRLDMDSIKNVKRFKLLVVPPNFYLTHGSEPLILKGSVLDWTAASFMTDSGYYFSEAVAIGHETFVLKSYSKTHKGNVLAKKTRDSFMVHEDLLERQIDGIFCVDGKLSFNRKLCAFIYLYYYRNQFIVSDTNFRIQYRGNTLDTFSHAQINVSKIDDGNERSLSGLPAIINSSSSTDGDFLFVKSNVPDKNQDIEEFKSGSTIDCYKLTDGSYVGSVYLANYKGLNLSFFQVVDNKLFALFGKYLTRFDLSGFGLDSER